MKALYRLFYYVSILLSCILAGVTLAGAFAGNNSAEGSKLLPFIGLALPVLLIANLAVAVYWTIRWRCWVIIPLIAILGNWGYLSRIFQLPLFDSASEPKVVVNARTPNVLTVATYNVDSFNREHTGFSCKQIGGFMKDMYADILCFQEFGIHKEFALDSLKVALAEWPYHYVPVSPAGKNLLQLAVFSRYPISNEHLVSYPESGNCSLWCDIEVNGQSIRLFNNHLQTTEVTRNRSKLQKELAKDDAESTERAAIVLTEGLLTNFKKRDEQANIINRLMTESPYPTLVCGDFNSLPSSYTYHTIKSDKLKDGFQSCGHGYMYTFKHFKHLLRIDYILHSHEFQGVDYFSPDLDYSDHKPVVMRVKI